MTDKLKKRKLLDLNKKQEDERKEEKKFIITFLVQTGLPRVEYLGTDQQHLPCIK